MNGAINEFFLCYKCFSQRFLSELFNETIFFVPFITSLKPGCNNNNEVRKFFEGRDDVIKPGLENQNKARNLECFEGRDDVIKPGLENQNKVRNLPVNIDEVAQTFQNLPKHFRTCPKIIQTRQKQ